MGEGGRRSLGGLVYGAGKRVYLLLPKSVRLWAYNSVYLWCIKRFPRLLYLRPGAKGWRVSRRGDMTKVERDGKELIVDHIDALLLIDEWPMWERNLLPPFGLEGKTVLDVGAACGDTALFYFLHGASRVIGVEADSNRCELFRENARNLGWNAEVINEPFELRHLAISHDFLKVDCEGGEELLVGADKLGPAVVEIHPSVIGAAKAEEIVSRHHLRRLDGDLWTNIPASAN